jgi:hypothetical protein
MEWSHDCTEDHPVQHENLVLKCFMQGESQVCGAVLMRTAPPPCTHRSRGRVNSLGPSHEPSAEGLESWAAANFDGLTITRWKTYWVMCPSTRLIK